MYTSLIANEHQILGKMELETERLKIRPPRIDDWEIFNSIVTNPECQRFVSKQLDAEEVRLKRFRSACKTFDNNDLNIICLKEDGTVIGWCQLDKTPLASSSYEIAMAFLPDYCENKYGTEVFKKLLEYASEAELIDDLWVQIHVDNQAALTIAHRFKFQEIDDDRSDFLHFYLDVSLF